MAAGLVDQVQLTLFRSWVKNRPPKSSMQTGAYEAIRAINYIIGTGSLLGPLVYQILGSLKGVGHLLPQALNQLAAGLGRSNSASTR